MSVITDISACDFADCYQRRIQATLDGTPVDIIGLADLVRNKIKSGRLKDLDDAQRLT